MDNYVTYIRKMIGKKPMFLVGAGVIVQDKEDRVLMIKRTDNGKWGIPGGSLELGETFEDAAARELNEETGIAADRLNLFRVYSGERMRFVYPNGDVVYNAVCIFQTKNYTGIPKGDGIESSEVGFFPLENLPNPIHPPDEIILEEYLKESNQ